MADFTLKNMKKDHYPGGLRHLKSITLAERMSKPPYFFGRKSEIEEISEFMDSDTYRILAFRGVAGTGKTALVSKIVEIYEGKKNIFYWKLYPFSTLSSMLFELSKFFSKIGKDKLGNYLKKTLEKRDLGRVLTILEDDLTHSNVMLIIDDYHYASEEIKEFFAAFKETLYLTDAKFVLVGRTIPLFYDKRDVMIRKRIKEMVLWGLDKASAKEFLSHRGIDESHHDRLYAITAGHPLMLELVTPETTAEAIDFVEKVVLEPLSDRERRALKLASVFRTPLPVETIMIAGVSESIPNGLVEKSLLQRIGDAYEEHEMFRTIIYNRLSAEEKVKYHLIAGEFYANVGTESAVIEAIYQLSKSYRYPEAAKLAIENADRLLKAGYARTLLEELDFFRGEEVPNYWADILLLKGDIFNQLGEPRKALELYKSCLEYTEAARPGREKGHLEMLWFGLPREVMRTQAKAHFNIGQVYAKFKETEAAREAFENSLRLYEELGDKAEASKIRELLRGQPSG